MAYFFYTILFLIGLGFGSFINVVSFRFTPENKVFDLKKIGGRSNCPYCRKTLRWYELIPILSFFIQAGKCRSCGHKLSWQYPLVELLTGLIFVAVPFFINPVNRLFGYDCYQIGTWSIWILVLLVLLLISLIDFRNFFIPDELIWLLIFLGSVLLFLESRMPKIDFFNHSFLRHYALIFNWPNNIWFNHLLAAAAGAVFFGFLFYFGKGKILGGGDVKLSFALGWLLGWPDILVAFILTFLFGGITGFTLMLSHKKTMKDFLPFAPFLAIGVTLTVLFGYQIINGYFSLMGL